jgi:hypothetical protein
LANARLATAPTAKDILSMDISIESELDRLIINASHPKGRAEEIEGLPIAPVFDSTSKVQAVL